MEKSLSHYLIVTDIDDTLLPHDGEIPKRNLEAIHRFQQKGGKFTFATGRSHYHCAELYKTLGINVPSAQNNGAYIYDCTTTVSYTHLIPDQSKRNMRINQCDFLYNPSYRIGF